MAAAAAAGPARVQKFLQSFSATLINENPQTALEKLTKALEQKPDDAQYYCQRAYCHALLGNYCDAVVDVQKSPELNPNNSIAMLGKQLCESHEKRKPYPVVLETFLGGQELDSADPEFTVWIERGQEGHLGGSSPTSGSQHGACFSLCLCLCLSLCVSFMNKSNLKKKNKIKMKKTEAVRLEKLEGQDVPKPKQFMADIKNSYASSSYYTRNWEKLVSEIKEEEKNEKLDGDAALNKLFQHI
ncbi:unnamed protein product [Nyctereutes procyonoides]|uniref:(raccoon dog) hypothetical protein n=1 Tax=Nyctereutes procyonoides TaxID=34880 RepID=A0A811ZJ48_NYCPR|nr:unnamed protein product [Nyctereutes procyonoides]